MKLPNKFKIVCNASQLTQKKKSCIDTFGFYNPSKCMTGKLVIVYQIQHTPLDETNKQNY